MTWIGLDGEGLGRRPHRYVMLCASDSEGRYQDYIEDVNGLSTRAALRFLMSLPAAHEKRRPCEFNVAGYYLSYDWTMILRDLPNRTLYRLLRPELRARPRDEGGGFSPVRYEGYELHYLSGLMRIAKDGRILNVWDVGKFYQARFVAALESAGFAAPELIKRMKEERGSWEDSDIGRMRPYCLEECRALALLCAQLEAQHAAIGIDLASWHGPGSTASGVLTQKGVLSSHAGTPAELVSPVDCAFFGGRFEQSTIGSRSGVYSYDIRSAYPYAASSLPCLAHSKWVKRRRSPTEGRVSLVRYRVTNIGARVWGPLPCRLADGSIVWPRGGSTGWVWSVEFDAARRHYRGVEYAGEHWELVGNCDCQPFAFLKELYRWRVERPENKQVVKLAMNSVYGKLAQSIGGGSRWSSRVWAGIITASTRARMLDLIGAHSDEARLASIATDGAYSTECLDIAGAELGGWECGAKGLMTFVRPGIYWSHADILEWYGRPGEQSVAEAAAKAVKSRGLSRRHMLTQVSRTEAAIAHGETKALLGTTIQFGGARECVYKTQSGLYKRSELYGEWYPMPASLSLAPAPKRDENWMPPLLHGVESAPYRTGSVEAQKLRLIGSLLEGRIT